VNTKLKKELIKHLVSKHGFSPDDINQLLEDYSDVIEVNSESGMSAKELADEVNEKWLQDNLIF